MSGRYFLDTNIFVYDVDTAEPAKQQKARDLIDAALRDGRGVISFQVVQEFSSLARRKFAVPLQWNDLRDYLQRVLAPLCEVHSSMELYRLCLDLAQRTGYSYYDSLILAAATSAGCDTLYSEDLQNGRVLGGLTIVNPF